jgi:hypothetical protein
MKKMTKFVGMMAVAFALTQTLQASLITGNIGFTGGVTFDTTSAGTATEVTSWINPIVTLDSGAFSTVASGSSVIFAKPWTFSSGVVSNFWSVGGFTFELLSSSIPPGSQSGNYPNGTVTVTGTGYVSGNGYTPTLMSWSFTAQDPAAQAQPEAWTFSASGASLPDGGSTVMLLGIALSGAALLRRKLMS